MIKIPGTQVTKGGDRILKKRRAKESPPNKMVGVTSCIMFLLYRSTFSSFFDKAESKGTNYHNILHILQHLEFPNPVSG